MGWLYQGVEQRLPAGVRERLEAAEPFASPIVELELTYLYETGRVSEPASAPLAALRRSIGLEVADVALSRLVQAATSLSWTRDPFDGLIAAHAIVAGAPLLTADRTILANLPQAVWD
ncbi:MAG TPA: PIN domain-containing protein [Solirubrobacterales bacterium]|nr:PIN domain-containing protein [Solirubrobacterales bacterium]